MGFIRKNSAWLTLTLICVLGLAIYSNTLNSPFQFDDENFIVNNLSIRNPANLRALWNVNPTRLLTYLSFALNYHLHQLHTLGYHLFNLIIHLLATVLVWQLTRITLATPYLRFQGIALHAKAISFFAGLIFLAHPIQTQAVTYIYQRSAALAAFFCLLALILYIKYRLLEDAGQAFKKRSVYYLAALLVTTLAMLTKETAFTLPLLIILYDLCFFKKRRGATWLRIIPFILTMLIIPATIVFHVRSVNIPAIHQILEKTAKINTWDYLLTQFRVIVTYIRLVILPLNQTLDYDYPLAKGLLTFPVISSMIFLLVILISAMRIFNKYRLLSFGIFWFFLALLPESSIIPLADVIFEHRLYLPMAGCSIFLASGIDYFLPLKNGKLACAMLITIVIAYGLATYQRNQAWKDKLTLWNDTVKKSPKKARVYNNRGLAYYHSRDLDAAISDYTKALDLDQDYAQAYSNRGLAYYEKGEPDNAILDHSRAIKINPKLADAYNNRGLAHYDQGELEKAILDFATALDINPYHYQAFSNIGNVYRSAGNMKQAIACYDRAIQLNPSYAAAYYNRAIAYYNTGGIANAIADYTLAIKINPGLAQAYNNRGLAYYKNGDRAKAFQDWDKAIEINPQLAEAYNNRGLGRFFNQEYEKAWADIRRAIGLGYPVRDNIIRDLKRALRK